MWEACGAPASESFLRGRAGVVPQAGKCSISLGSGEWRVSELRTALSLLRASSASTSPGVCVSASTSPHLLPFGASWCLCRFLPDHCPRPGTRGRSTALSPQVPHLTGARCSRCQISPVSCPSGAQCGSCRVSPVSCPSGARSRWLCQRRVSSGPGGSSGRQEVLPLMRSPQDLRKRADAGDGKASRGPV